MDDLSPAEALAVLKSRILADGYRIVMDLDGSHGCYLRDGLSGREFLDFYSFFASMPVGYNHPRMRSPEVRERLADAAMHKVANPDIYTQGYADFVRTFDAVAGLPGFDRFFFIAGGALAVENALKAAFDWKVRKNLAAGRGEIGQSVIHFRQAFHGRSGYTLSLTNTADPRKTMYFPKFDWPRIDNPGINFALPEPQRTQDVQQREAVAIAQIGKAIEQRPHDIAALIIEPIQGEGGDVHFRREFFEKLRGICDRAEMLLIFDEVQTGIGITGKMWCCEHFGVYPDIIAFGKKTQVCGIMAGPRLDEVDSVFKVPSRINSTWGGNLADMARSAEYLRIVRDEDLVARAGVRGEYLQSQLAELAGRHPALVSAVRGRGLMCAFDLPDTRTRDALRQACFDRNMLILGCGQRSVRFRPVLDVEQADIDAGVSILHEALGSMA
jgi:L-lysine 6-transaminase